MYVSFRDKKKTKIETDCFTRQDATNFQRQFIP